MALVVGNTPGTSLALAEDKIKAYKHFANKIWNASRFVIENSDDTLPNTGNISEEDQKTIFTAFHRGSNVGDISGTGLGLSIVKKAIDLLGGNIEVRSTMAQGTRIGVTLPLR